MDTSQYPQDSNDAGQSAKEAHETLDWMLIVIAVLVILTYFGLPYIRGIFISPQDVSAAVQTVAPTRAVETAPKTEPNIGSAPAGWATQKVEVVVFDEEDSPPIVSER